MEDFLFFIVVLFILLGFITLLGHGIWVFLALIFRTIFGIEKEPPVESPIPADTITHHCSNCGVPLSVQMKFCGGCGAHRPTLHEEEQLKELEATIRQLERLHQAGEYKADYEELRRAIGLERDRILFPQGRPGKADRPSPKPEPATPQPKIVVPLDPAADTAPPFALPEQQAPPYGEWSKDSDEAELPPTPKPPRKPFADVLAAFMEQSNVRWGEIIGGLLIIGCSTALVISLWTQISRVPVIKFMIFTTVTAALFGIGFYTAHHWKLPTTSRGILTIATLLVPLNFLAIAAVSTNTTPGIAVVGGDRQKIQRHEQ